MSVVTFDRSGESGNIFYIMGKTYAALKQEGRKQDADTMMATVKAQHSYEDALGVIAEYVDLIEV